MQGCLVFCFLVLLPGYYKVVELLPAFVLLCSVLVWAWVMFGFRGERAVGVVACARVVGIDKRL